MSDHAGLEPALEVAIQEIEKEAIPYMLIGGLALSAWGLPRATLDVDLTLWTEAEALERVCRTLIAKFTARSEDPLGFARRTRVLPVTHGGVRIDFVFAAFAFEKKMIERAQKRPLGNLLVNTATPEDLILLKLASPRGKDQEDIKTILAAYGRSLNWEYLLPVGEMLAEALEQPELKRFLETERKRLGSL